MVSEEIFGKGTVRRERVIEVVSGCTSGAATTIIVHPLDLLKTRLQVDRLSFSMFGGSVRQVDLIRRKEGGLQAFYRGLAPNLLGNCSSWGLYFLLYEELKLRLERKALYVGSMHFGFFTAATLAGMLTSICTNPIWVVKTRMLSSGRDHPGAYVSFRQGLSHLYRIEGARGFFHGLLPSMLGVSHGAFYFTIYEEMKKRRLRQRSRKGEDLRNLDLLAVSSVSKTVAGSFTYPLQLVRSRLQMYNTGRFYTGILDLMTQVWKQEGFLGYYKGFVPNLLRIVPSTCITFLVYENTKHYLRA